MKPARLSPFAGLLGGVIAGFLLAAMLGAYVSTYSGPTQFVRFQQWLNPQTSYFPPFRMLERLALKHWHPGQTVVIVAGNSIFNGVAQPTDQIWSRRLQEILPAERYVVVNLSFNGANPTDAGALVAESLLRRGIPVVLLVNSAPTPPMRTGGGIYGGYYWDARAQSALLPYPAREEDIRGWESQLTPSERQRVAETRRAASLNSWLYFQELWHHVGLHLAFTVWTPLTRTLFWLPRDEWPDPEREPLPLAQRFRNNPAGELAIVRSYGEAYGERGPGDSWQFSAQARANLRQQIEAAYPPLLRPRMIMVLCESAPWYRRQLSADEQARDLAVWEGCASVWREQGIACFINGLDFDDTDYNDRTHLTPSGGRKLAARVAAEILQLKPAPVSP